MSIATPIAPAELGQTLRLQVWAAIKTDEFSGMVLESWKNQASTQAELDRLDEALRNVHEHEREMWDSLWDLQTVA